MKTYQVAIYDEEVDFAFSLMNYMNHMSEFPCMGIAFSEREKVKEYCLQNNNQVDLLLLDESMRGSFITESSSRIPILWLSQEEASVSNHTIYKYQSAESLLEAIVKRVGCSSNKERARYQAETTIVYGVYSPIGRCGKTNLARGICQYQEGKSLYIGMETYRSFEEDAGISQEFYYRLKIHSQNITMLLEQLQEDEYGVSIIPSAICYLDYREVSVEDIRWFLNEVKQMQLYRSIVFDIGTGSLLDFQTFSLFDQIFILTLEEDMVQLQHFLTFIKQSFQTIYQNINVIKVPNTSYQSLKMEEYIEGILRRE